MAGQLEPGMSLKELADAWAAHRGKTLADLHEAVGSVMDVRAAPAMTSKRAARLRLVCSRDGCGERLDADMTGLRCLSCTISDYARREVSGLPRLLGLCRKKGDMTAYKKCEADVRAFFDKPHTGKMPRL